jgi:hypothetical protein
LIDKTFVEGGRPNPITTSPLTGGIKLDATSIGATNPYGRGSSREITDQRMLPTGDEKIPLGSGVIHGTLGSGGMARVYKIWNDKLEVFRAVKVLLPTQQKDLRNRFETEAKITAKLHHPNIVEVYNVGEWQGLPYLEMEYINGESLDAIIAKRGKLPHDVCCAAAIFVARALVYAHGQEFLIYGKNYHGVIHRDLKPANVMISLNGDVKLMDFGIARPTETSLHTVDGNIVGTMQYLSPEQIDGIDIDCRTDIYSFGAIVYEMLTGAKTFPQETITNLIKKKIVNEYRKFNDFDFAISPVLSRITQKCLQAEKSARFSSAREVLDELESAFKTMSIEDPAAILRGYLCDPEHYVAPAERKTIRISTPSVKKIAIPVAVALVFLAIVGGFVATMMTHRAKTLGQVTVQTPIAPPSIAPAPAPAAGQIDSKDLKPLAASTTAPGQPAPAPDAQKQTVGPRPPAVPTVPSKPAPAIPKNTLSIDNLQKKYGTNDLLSIGSYALKAGNVTEALFALEAMRDKNADLRTKTLLLLEAYIQAGRFNDALQIATGQNVADAQFDNLCGRLYQKLGKDQQALDCFDNALTKPSTVRSHSEIRNDALYYSALVRSDLCRKDPGSDNREQAVNSWNVVKKMYLTDTENARFKKAEKELSSLK